MKRTSKWIQSLGFFFLAISLLLTIVDFWCFYKPFYNWQYQKNNTTVATGLNEEDLNKTTDLLFAYLKDEREDLNMQALVHGEEREVFDAREKAHMVDVKNLYLGAMQVRNYLGILGILLVIATGLFATKDRFLHLFKSYQKGVGAFLGFILILGLFAVVDFTSFWTNFHHVFFTNDLWLLDPNISIMINMVPEPFFSALVMVIVVSYLLALLITYIVLYLFQKKVNA